MQHPDQAKVDAARQKLAETQVQVPVAKSTKSAIPKRPALQGKELDEAFETLKEVQKPSIEDNIDQCLNCGKEIPPGPDFCSKDCEEEADTKLHGKD